MAYGVARISEADDLIDWTAVARTYIRQPGSKVGGRLTSDAVLRRDDDLRFVAGFPQRRDQGTGNDEVSALRQRRAGRHNSDSHLNSRRIWLAGPYRLDRRSGNSTR